MMMRTASIGLWMEASQRPGFASEIKIDKRIVVAF